MSESQPMYRFTFFRPPEIWKDGWIECDDVGRVNYRIGMEFGPILLSKVLKFTGLPDGDIVCDETGTKSPLHHYFESAYRLADINVEPHISPQIAKSLTLIADGHAWMKIENKNDLSARDFVIGDGILSTLGKAALTSYGEANAKTTPNVTLTVNQREAFNIIVNSPDKWKDLHGKTQNLLVNSGWVEMNGKVPSLTSVGQDIYDTIVSAPKVEIEPTAPSEAAIKAVTALRDNPNVWAKVGPRMKGDLKARGFVVIENKDYATITPEALQAISDFKVKN
jgi:hypothetical protein